jgi:hypothetical protein
MFIRLNLKAVGRKMKGALFYFYGHHGDVIMEFFGLDELVQAQVDAFDDFVGGKSCTFLLILEKYMLKVTSSLSAILAGGPAFFWNQHL